jgi:hypothetical protein
MYIKIFTPRIFYKTYDFLLGFYWNFYAYKKFYLNHSVNTEISVEIP